VTQPRSISLVIEVAPGRRIIAEGAAEDLDIHRRFIEMHRHCDGSNSRVVSHETSFGALAGGRMLHRMDI
jgi:hypothetical protein